MTVLETSDVGIRFGGVHALRGVSLDVGEQQIVAVIGPNGAGKTTFLNCVSGLYRPDSGEILLDGRQLEGTGARERARLGIARTFQTPELFRKMTVEENLLVPLGVGAWWRAVTEAVGTPGSRRLERLQRQRATAVASAFGLGAVLDRRAGDLSFGQQRIVELARALASGPRLVLLDEPGSGLDTQESARFGEILLALRDELGFAALLVEHDMALVEQVSDVTYVFDFGSLLTSGSTDEVRQNPAVIAAYLGDRRASA